jgi:hypothetical protein
MQPAARADWRWRWRQDEAIVAAAAPASPYTGSRVRCPFSPRPTSFELPACAYGYFVRTEPKTATITQNGHHWQREYSTGGWVPGATALYPRRPYALALPPSGSIYLAADGLGGRCLRRRRVGRRPASMSQGWWPIGCAFRPCLSRPLLQLTAALPQRRRATGRLQPDRAGRAPLLSGLGLALACLRAA